MLDQNTKSQLKTYLAHLKRPLVITASYGTGSTAQDLRALLAVVAESSDLISVQESPSGQSAPHFGIARAGEEPRVSFSAVPLGHEFPSLVLALLHVGGHAPRLPEDVVAAASSLTDVLNFEVVMSLTCHSCPETVQALNTLAALNPTVTTRTIDGALHPVLVAEREVMAVPALFLNGQPFASGRMGVGEILTKLGSTLSTQKIQQLSEQPPFDVLVLGGGPAGAAAAVYAARKGIRTGLLTDRMGGQTNDTMGIENYIAVQETTGPRFSADLESQVRHYGVNLVVGDRAAQLTARNADGLLQVQTVGGALLSARTVVLATGARWRTLDVPGEDEYRNRGVAYCPHCDGPLFKGKRVAVVGGGNSGVEAAIDLAGLVTHVTVLEAGAHLRADAVLVQKLQSLANVTVLTQVKTTAILGDGKRVVGLQYQGTANTSSQTLELEGVFVQIGLVPNTEFLAEKVARTSAGELVVDARGQTSVPGVFAAGDATTTPFKQIVIAAGDGAKAALSAFDYLIRNAPPVASV